MRPLARCIRIPLVGVVAGCLSLATGAAIAAPGHPPAPGAGRSGLPGYTPDPVTINVGLPPCDGQAVDVSGHRPGDLLAAQELPTDPALIANARAWRVLYVTAGTDEAHLQPVCGTVVAPSDPSRVKADIVAWSHGTMGVHQICQPSMNPDRFVFGPTPAGIGAVTYGGDDGVEGTPADGIVQTLVNDGRVVAATDYYAGIGQPGTGMQPYALGVPSGAAVLDSARSAAALLRGVYPTSEAAGAAWDVLTWGHSQGGHAAAWAGQLAHDYYGETGADGGPSFNLVGVALEAPASQFVATPGSPAGLVGDHLGDREMHQPALQWAGIDIGVVGPMLFSFVTGPWEQYAAMPRSAGADFPVGPPGPDPDQSDLLTRKGVGTAGYISQRCGVQGLGVIDSFLATVKYGWPSVNAYFQQPMWGIKGSNGFQGRLDATCVKSDPPAGVAAWCGWLAYNMPGPNGVNPFDKIPRDRDNDPSHVFIAQGANDTVVHCVDDGPGVPSDDACVARQLYDSYGLMCDNDGSVQFAVWDKGSGSPASHLSIAGQVADNGHAQFRGSPLDGFMSNAFAGTVPPGCLAATAD